MRGKIRLLLQFAYLCSFSLTRSAAPYTPLPAPYWPIPSALPVVKLPPAASFTPVFFPFPDRIYLCMPGFGQATVPLMVF
jgi:hypothetical protein